MEENNEYLDQKRISEVEGSYTEKILHELGKIQARDRCDLIEAYTAYCDEHDMDVEELLEYLDKTAIQLLKQSALESNKVRKKVAVCESALPFE